jgi:putative membrane protein
LDAAATLTPRSDRAFFLFNALISSAAVAFIAFILGRDAGPGGTVDLSFVPAVNATCNAMASLCLIAGYVAIRRRAVQVHRACMVTALAFSTVFLVGYLSYHYVHGDTKYSGTGAMRAVYLAILASHIVLSITVVPGALTSFYFALTGQFTRHRRLNRVFLPIWLYVSVTGVMVFLMLQIFGSVRAA